MEAVMVAFWAILSAALVGTVMSAVMIVTEEVRFRKWLREEQDRMIKWLEGFDDDKR